MSTGQDTKREASWQLTHPPRTSLPQRWLRTPLSYMAKFQEKGLLYTIALLD